MIRLSDWMTGGRMLRLVGGQVESLFDELLPVEVRELPAELATLDRLLGDPCLLAPIEQAWERAARGHGRPTIPMGSFVRLMVIKQRTGWGYETLVREVSDSLHLRRFCLLPLTQRVPDESTVRKLVRRLGPEVVAELTRVVIGKAQRETRFAARAVRIDSTVVEADIRYPTDAGLAWQGVRVLAREGRKLAGRLGGQTRRVVDRSRQLGKTVRAISRTLARRTGQRRDEVMELNTQAGRILTRSIGEARMLATQARASARGRGARAKLRAAQRLEELADHCQRIATQIQQRQRGEAITDRLVSLADPDARPIRKGKLGKPNEFGYVAQLAEVTANTGRGARGYVLPAASTPGNPGENRLLPQTAAELDPARPDPTRGRPRRRLRARADHPNPGWARTHQDLHLRSGRAGLPPHPPAPGPLPHRLRGPHQPPQTRVWAAAQPPARRPGPADLDRLGGPGLQPRHPRHPGCLTGPLPDCTRLQRQPTAIRRSHARPFIRGK
jgi:transposase, IS5 family